MNAAEIKASIEKLEAMADALDETRRQFNGSEVLRGIPKDFGPMVKDSVKSVEKNALKASNGLRCMIAQQRAILAVLEALEAR